MFVENNDKKDYFCAVKRAIRYILLSVLLLWAASQATAVAQEVVWDVDFDFRFDNREYGDPSKMVVPSTTIFGANLLPEVGLSWGGGHSLMAGANLHSDMGSEKFFGEPEFVAYYDYSSRRFRTSLGLFPRNKLSGNYSRATFEDTYSFFHPTIEGAMIRYVGSYWFAELACDWNGLRSPSRREMFTLLFASEAHKNYSYAGFNMMLHHHAASDTAKGVVDNGLANIYIGLSLGSITNLDQFTLQASWLQGYQNDRHYIGTPTLPGGYELSLKMRRGAVGVEDTFYKGDNLMPYWNSPYEDAEGGIYGSSLYSGDPFYRVGKSGFYNRLELYYEPRLSGGVSLRISSVHHYDGAHWGWQQRIALRVDLNSGMF